MTIKRGGVQSPKNCGKNRNALTLIEILVVLTIISLLLALLLPAVQAAREAARRVLCTNNLRQCAIGLHAYISAFDVLPGGQGGAGHSLHVAILPYLDQEVIYNSFNFIRGASGIDSENLTIRNTTVATFAYPSDPQQPLVRGNSYAGNVGDVLRQDTYNGIFNVATLAPRNLSVSDVTDGTSRRLSDPACSSTPTGAGMREQVSGLA
jgi:prepilin-type N-terminal cleavage/methylation domain-containing protein